MRILAKFQSMASSEIMTMIPADQFNRIKAQDSKPVFRAYVVGHEGESEGRLVGHGNVVKRWFSSTIRKLYDRIQYGLKIFHEHNADNSQDPGRDMIGEVVGKGLKTIKDRLSAIAVIYIRPDYRGLPLDVASIEAEVSVEEAGRGIFDIDLKKITGIALGNSAVNTPGFRGATLLAQLQAFAERTPSRTRGGRTQEFGETVGGNMTLDEMREFIKAEKLTPSELFSMEALTADPVVTGFVKQREKQASAGEFGFRKQDQAVFEEKKTALEAQLKEKDEKLQALQVEIARGRIPELYGKAKDARKLTEQQHKFIAVRLKEWTPKGAETMEKELNELLDKEVDKYKEIFGDPAVGGDGETGQKAGAGDGAGTGPKDNKPAVKPEDKFLSPETNPMIPRII